jgi:hypothetical protein
MRRLVVYTQRILAISEDRIEIGQHTSLLSEPGIASSSLIEPRRSVPVLTVLRVFERYGSFGPSTGLLRFDMVACIAQAVMSPKSRREDMKEGKPQSIGRSTGRPSVPGEKGGKDTGVRSRKDN